MEQKRSWKQTLLFILSILGIIGGVLTLAIGIFGMTTAPQIAAESGMDTDTATIGLGVIIALSVLLLLGGIFGVIASRNPAKTTPFIVVTTIAFVLCAIAVSQSTGGGLLFGDNPGGALDPTLIGVVVMTVVMDALGFAVRNDYKNGR